MFTITECPLCGKDFMYHGQDSYLFRDITVVDEVGNNEIISTVICQECYEIEKVKDLLYNWPEIDSVFQTSDGEYFIRYEEAVLHTNELLNSDPENVVDTSIREWFEEFSGKDTESTIRYIILGEN